MNDTNTKLKISEKAGYSLGDVASSLYFNMFMLYLLYFYTDVFGISAAVAGTMIGITRLWDAFTDPGVGMIADRTNSRWGKYRPYILFSVVPFAIIGVLTFSTPDLSANLKIVYAYVTYALLSLAYTFVNVPYTSLMGVLTPNSLERTSISTYKLFGATVGGMIAQYLTLTLVDYFGKGDEATGFRHTAIVFSIFVAVMFFICFLSTKERITVAPQQKGSVKNDLKDLMKNRPWWILLVSGLFLLTWICIRMGANVYYFKYYVADTKSLSMFLVMGSAASAAGLLLTGVLAKKIGKKRLIIISMAGNSIFTAAMFIPMPHEINMMFAFNILSGFLGGPSFAIIWAMYADTADYSEWKFNRRATGLVFSAALFTQKMGWSLGAVIAGLLLTVFGYVAQAEQTTDSVMGIRLLMSIIPGIIGLAGASVMFFYKLDDKMMVQIEKELKERKEIIN
jgi:glycoside/pentoside/hexuronide:cation symporter, GPH family